MFLDFHCAIQNKVQYSIQVSKSLFIAFVSGRDGQRLLSVTGSGVQRSLMVTINIEHYEFYRDKQPGGIFIMIHGQEQTPVRIQEEMIPVGFATYVKVREVIHKVILLKLKFRPTPA